MAKSKKLGKTQPAASQKVVLKSLKNLKKGDRGFVYKNVGFGYTTYEQGDVVTQRKGDRLFTNTFESSGMEWKNEQWQFDAGLGMVTSLVALEDVPPGEQVL